MARTDLDLEYFLASYRLKILRFPEASLVGRFYFFYLLKLSHGCATLPNTPVGLSAKRFLILFLVTKVVLPENRRLILFDRKKKQNIATEIKEAQESARDRSKSREIRETCLFN